MARFFNKIVIIGLILHFYLLARNKGIAGKTFAVKIFSVHIHRRNLVIFVGGVVIYALVRVTAGGVKGDFVLAPLQLATAPLLVNRA